MRTSVSLPSCSRETSRAICAGPRCDSTTTATVPRCATASPSPITSALYPERPDSAGAAGLLVTSAGADNPAVNLHVPFVRALRAASRSYRRVERGAVRHEFQPAASSVGDGGLHRRAAPALAHRGCRCPDRRGG